MNNRCDSEKLKLKVMGRDSANKTEKHSSKPEIISIYENNNKPVVIPRENEGI